MVEKQLGRTPVELQNLIDLPESCVDIWSWFLDLHNNRGTNGFSENPISFSDMYAYFQLISVTPNPWEVVVLKKLDNIALKFMSKEAEKRNNSQKTKKPSK